MTVDGPCADMAGSTSYGVTIRARLCWRLGFPVLALATLAIAVLTRDALFGIIPALFGVCSLVCWVSGLQVRQGEIRRQWAELHSVTIRLADLRAVDVERRVWGSLIPLCLSLIDSGGGRIDLQPWFWQDLHALKSAVAAEIRSRPAVVTSRTRDRVERFLGDHSFDGAGRA